MAAVDEAGAGLGGGQPAPAEDAGGMTPEADEQDADGALGGDVGEEVVAGRERRERGLALDARAVAAGVGDEPPCLVGRGSGDPAVRLGPALEPAAEALRRELVALPAQAGTPLSWPTGSGRPHFTHASPSTGSVRSAPSGQYTRCRSTPVTR